MKPQKRLALTEATYNQSGESIEAYEIHIGETVGPDCERGWLSIEGHKAGATSKNGLVQGCYLHGLFASDAFRKAYLKELGVVSDLRFGEQVETTLDALADHLEEHLNIDVLIQISETPFGT